jgi:hypothetical protein
MASGRQGCGARASKGEFIMRIVLALGLFALFVVSAAEAADRRIEDFYGRWIGSGQATGGGDGGATQARDSEVIIEKAADGFKISWTTMSSDLADATRSRVRSSELTFKRGKKPGFFIDVKSGHALDDGKKTTWARVKGDVLSITQLVVADDGQWDMTVYDRTLKGGDEMTLAFTRITNGAIARQASVAMVRARN